MLLIYHLQKMCQTIFETKTEGLTAERLYGKYFWAGSLFIYSFIYFQLSLSYNTGTPSHVKGSFKSLDFVREEWVV